MQPILKQVAIAISRDGTIGQDGGLAISSQADLGEFARFTYRTVLILGKNTAQELIDKKVYATADRPWVVISRGQHVLDKEENYGHVFYAACLDPAVEVAEQLIKGDRRLVGWTIAGGARTYEKLINQINAVETVGYLNSAYVLAIGKDLSGTKLSVTSDGFIDTVNKTLVSPAIARRVDASYHCKDAVGVEGRVPATAVHLLDGNTFNSESVEHGAGFLSVKQSDGNVFTTRFDQVAGFETETKRQVLTIWLKNRDLNKEIRLEAGREGLNYLAMLLRRYI